MELRNALYLLTFLCILSTGCRQSNTGTASQPETPVKQWTQDEMRDIPGLSAKRGVVTKTEDATPGYVLFNPTFGTSAYLMNLDGVIVHEWKSDLTSMLSYLQDDGSIIRHDRVLDDKTFAAGGQSGIISRVSWDGELMWRYRYATPTLLTHHDLAVLPNGNILANAWEVKTKAECIAMGLNPDGLPDEGLWFDKVIEIKPEGARQPLQNYYKKPAIFSRGPRPAPHAPKYAG